MSLQDGHDEIVLAVEAVSELAMRVLTRNGLSSAQAEPLARAMAAAERDDCRSHGLQRLLGCLDTMAHPRFNRNADPRPQEVSAAATRIDADFGYSLLAFERGLPLLVQKAQALGVSVLAINNCFHSTALWPEVEAITAHGLAALVMNPSHSWVAPAGGSKPVLGTNPIAFGWPRQGHPPYVFDFATSAAARAEIALHRRDNKTIPVGWGIDSDGNPTTDPQAVLSGAMLTFGGHKGSALATMVELLAGPLIGDMTSMQSMDFDAGAKAAPCHGELVIAFNPALLGRDSIERNDQAAEALFGAIAGQGARLPSERRYRARLRSDAEGIRVSRALHDRILALAGG
ncbi:LDH2 family malate/lactate/ureidoglycolate dehydrogenase [Mycoplana dimorpha]|uniref:LDH2 family malate/lactate/ureidoglycolate dehydrogenase n=1 Tax=Mycoplana dimorpha TaxID=28320 RepID=A0A2T5BDT6_MYCDI|nr:LDH2 family malate/lactate/ureidoglycolate dehydrogenase [Mycoplana dimorpha]